MASALSYARNDTSVRDLQTAITAEVRKLWKGYKNKLSTKCAKLLLLLLHLQTE